MDKFYIELGVFLDVCDFNEIQNNPDIYSSYQNIEFTNVYHHLRHSFGTDIFYNLCEGANKHF